MGFSYLQGRTPGLLRRSGCLGSPLSLTRPCHILQTPRLWAYMSLRTHGLCGATDCMRCRWIFVCGGPTLAIEVIRPTLVSSPVQGRYHRHRSHQCNVQDSSLGQAFGHDLQPPTEVGPATLRARLKRSGKWLAPCHGGGGLPMLHRHIRPAYRAHNGSQDIHEIKLGYMCANFKEARSRLNLHPCTTCGLYPLLRKY